ncbi:MAG: pentapeptide repeat-containing protein [Rhodobacter sp.]|nr:pentapeptide repeat-containing protein [Rhodobacter sp.]
MNKRIIYLAAVAWANGGTLSGATLIGAYLIGANLSGAYLIRANLSGANLREANLREANLRGANLSGANLREANLREANLSGANLSGANLSGAYLRGAYLRGAKYQDDTLAARIAAADRMDGYTFHLFRLEDGTHKVMAGCRWFTVDEYRAHVAKEYPGTDKARETLDILEFFERRLTSE